MKLENLKGQKLIEPIYFCFLREKFLFWGKCLKFPPKKCFLTFAKKLVHSCFFFDPKMVPERVFCDSSKSTCLKKNLVVKWSIFWSILLEGIKWYLSYFSSEKAVVWWDVARFAFHAVRLYDCLIIWENQVISYIFYACREASTEGSIWDYHFWLCVVR